MFGLRSWPPELYSPRLMSDRPEPIAQNGHVIPMPSWLGHRLLSQRRNVLGQTSPISGDTISGDAISGCPDISGDRHLRGQTQ